MCVCYRFVKNTMAARNSRSPDVMSRIIQMRLEELEKSVQRLCKLQADVIASVKQHFVQSDDMLNVSIMLDHARICLDSSVLELSDWISEQGIDLTTHGGEQSTVDKGSVSTELLSLSEVKNTFVSGKESELKKLTDAVEELTEKSDAVADRLTKLELELSPNFQENQRNEMEALKTCLSEKEKFMNEEICRIQEKLETDVHSKLEQLTTENTQLFGQMKEMEASTEKDLFKEAMKAPQAFAHTFDTIVLPLYDELLMTMSEETFINKNIHNEFIDREHFQVHNLPEAFRDKGLKNCIIELAKLSVRIKLYKISKDRPQFCPDTGRPYPFSGGVGDGSLVRMGSGWVSDVEIHYKTIFDHSSRSFHTTQNIESCKVSVCTAKHLLFDQTETANMEVTFTLDGETFPSNTWAWKGSGHDNSDINYLTMTTTCPSSAQRLWNLKQNVDQTVAKMNTKYDRGNTPGGLAIMISHPYGVPIPKISLGTTTRLVESNFLNPSGQTLSYIQVQSTLPTCVGCSGAFVWPVGNKAPEGSVCVLSK